MTALSQIGEAPLRSWLFVPGDSDKKLGKVDGCGADAVILDLEDSVAAARKPDARRAVAAFLLERTANARTCQLWVRINPFDSGLALDDLVAVVAAAPDGIMLPKCGGGGRSRHALALSRCAGTAGGGRGRVDQGRAGRHRDGGGGHSRWGTMRRQSSTACSA